MALLSTSTPCSSEAEIERTLSKVGRHTAYVHLADGAQRTEPGSVPFDYRPGFRALKAHGFCGWLTMECKATDIPSRASSARWPTSNGSGRTRNLHGGDDPTPPPGPRQVSGPGPESPGPGSRTPNPYIVLAVCAGLVVLRPSSLAPRRTTGSSTTTTSRTCSRIHMSHVV